MGLRFKEAEYALELEKLNKFYGTQHVVQDLDFKIKRGSIFALLGPNGAGKSTTINMTVGLARRSSGQLKIFGLDTKKHPVFTRRLVGIMHQEVVFDNFFKLRKSLEMHSGFYGKKLDKEWLDYLMERLDLHPHAHKKPLQLSGGMKRRLMLAKALIHKPPLLILDEPTAGVDVELRHRIWEFVLELNSSLEMTILLTTHYLEEAEALCEKIAIMDHGKLLALEETKKLIAAQNSKNLEEVFLRLIQQNEKEEGPLK